MTVLATITSKNQLTIPKEVTKILNWKNVRKVLVTVQGEEMVVKPLASRVDLLAGSLAKYAKGKTNNFKKVRQETERIIAEEIAKEGL